MLAVFQATMILNLYVLSDVDCGPTYALSLQMYYFIFVILN